MECEELESRLTDVAAGQADDAERTALERHLEQCASCRAEAQSLRSAMEFLKGIAVPDPGDGFWDGFPAVIGERIRQTREPVPGASEHRTAWTALRHLVQMRLRVSVPAVAAALLVAMVSGALTVGILSKRTSDDPLARLRQSTGDVSNGGTVTGSERLTRAPRAGSGGHIIALPRAPMPADLGLNEVTRDKLMHAQRAWLASIDRLKAQRRVLLASLRRELRNPDNDVTLAATLQALQRNSQRIGEADANHEQLLERVLTPRQHALYLLSNEEQPGNGWPKAGTDEGASTHPNDVVKNRGE